MIKKITALYFTNISSGLLFDKFVYCYLYINKCMGKLINIGVIIIIIIIIILLLLLSNLVATSSLILNTDFL